MATAGDPRCACCAAAIRPSARCATTHVRSSRLGLRVGQAGYGYMKRRIEAGLLAIAALVQPAHSRNSYLRRATEHVLNRSAGMFPE